MTMSSLHPTLLFFAGAGLLWALPLIGRRALILLVPASAFFVISQLEPGTYFSYQLFGFDLDLLRATIFWHHKVTPYRGPGARVLGLPLAESASVAVQPRASSSGERPALPLAGEG